MSYSPHTDFFSVYAQRLDIVPQLNLLADDNLTRVTRPVRFQSHQLKRTHWTDRSIMEGIMSLAQFLTLVDLYPCFGKAANGQLAMEMALG